jgi:hypothetical protein
MARRNGFRWSVNECLRLQREFELLQLPLETIADMHERSVNAIMYKLHSEGFADYNELYLKERLNCVGHQEDDDVSEFDEADEHSEDDTYDPYNFGKNLLDLQKQITRLANYYIKNKKNSLECE